MFFFFLIFVLKYDLNNEFRMMGLLKKIFKGDDNFGIVVSHDEIFDLTGVQQYRPVLKLDIDSLIKAKPLLTQADPFLYVKGNTLYLFYESQRSGARGLIRMMKTDNLVDWTEPLTVLQEPFHLSFPFVFDHCGSIYMIPESQVTDSIRLYRGNEDLNGFTLEKILLSKPRTPDIKFNFCDSHILKKDNLFYLFTSVAYKWTYHLELYYTDDLLHHEFVKHPSSPIYVGNDFGRSGGSIIHLDDYFYRISQNCSKGYGGNISLHRITALDERKYGEELCFENVLHTGGRVYRDGGHQLNVVKYNNEYIYATDFRSVSWSWYQMYLKIRGKLRSFSAK